MTDTLQPRQTPTSAPRVEPPADELAFDAAVAFSAVGPTVVVKRKKAMEHGAPAAHGPQEPGNVERVPRVFRVRSAMQDAEASSGKALGADQGMDDPKPAPHADAVGAATGPRRRRRVPRPPVTIIRPGEDRHVTMAGAAGFRDTATSPSAAVEPDLRFGQALEDHRRYVELELQIEALQREAEALRKDEAAVAVRWIRKAIAKYGIGAAELGF